MFVTLRVLPGAARALQRRQFSSPEAEELVQLVRKLGFTLSPIHPGIEDDELMKYFAVEVPSQSIADQVVQRLRQCTAIDAAYVKPPDELP